MDNFSKQFDEWKKGQAVAAKVSEEKNKLNSIDKKVNRKSNRGNLSAVNETTLEALPDEFLEKLTAPKSLVGKKKRISSDDNLVKPKRKIVIDSISPAIDKGDYIPLNTNVTSTDFKIARLDKEINTNSLAAAAVEFYSRKKFGKNVRRQPVEQIFVGVKKKIAKQSLCKSNL